AEDSGHEESDQGDDEGGKKDLCPVHPGEPLQHLATVAGVLVVLRFVVDDESAFLDEARQALTVLADRPGYRSGQLCRAYDEPTSWCLITEWESVGAYRRAL